MTINRLTPFVSNSKPSLSPKVFAVATHLSPSYSGGSFDLISPNQDVFTLQSEASGGESQLGGLRKIIAAHIKATFSYFW